MALTLFHLCFQKYQNYYLYLRLTNIGGAIASAGLYAYISGSPQVFINIFKVTEQQFGWIFAFNAAGLIGCSQLNSIALRRYKSEQLTRTALIVQCAAGSALFILAVSGVLNVFVTVGFIFIFLGSQGFIFPNASALAMAPFSKNAGSASALMGAIQMGIGAMISAGVSLLSDNTARPMTGIMMTCSLTALFILLLASRFILRRPSVITVEEKAVEMVTES